jgi:hypothetical protein
MSEDTALPILDATTIGKAVRNEPSSEFTLTNSHTKESKTFTIQDLDYDSYCEFCDLARPIIASVAGAIDMGTSPTGEMKLQFNAAGINYETLIKLAGKELPRMAWLCCKQSDPRIKLEDVKRLARRPMVMLEIVLKQIKQNEIVKEFADFFPRIAGALQELLPDATEALTPATTPPTE